MENQKPDSNAIENANFIQSLLDRIKNGEDEKSVRNDFIDRFRDSEHAVIMHSEQILLDRGISPKDLHIFFEWHGELAKISAPITHTLAAGHPIQTMKIKRSKNFSRASRRLGISEISRHFQKNSWNSTQFGSIT